ncbi:hypothetical protein BS78_01G252300 [Paspalum vaginatum]|nr:hypothetical protein BS78_01G252300 [Paspalum vaginatum]
MSKLLSSSTQTNPNSYRRFKKREIHDLPVLPTSSNFRSALSGGAERTKKTYQDPICGAKERAWRDWTNLGDGPAGVIAELLLASDVTYFVSFRSVCRPWRLCSIGPHAHGILDRPGGSPYCLGFLNESTGCSRYLELQELHGHDVFGPTTEGLLVLLDRNTYAVRLLNPFTRQAAKLPGSLSVSGAGLADDCTIAVNFDQIGTLAVIKPGDTDWTVTSADQPPRLAVAANLIRPFYRIAMDSVHLVDNEYELYRVDLDAREMVPVRGFVGRAVFIVRQLARSVSPLVFRSINADSIYLGFESHERRQ